MRRPYRASGQENGECTALLAYGYPVVETLCGAQGHRRAAPRVHEPEAILRWLPADGITRSP